MTPKEKTKELVDKFMAITVQYVLNGEANESDVKDEAKQCALIAVEEIIESYWLNIKFGWTGAVHENNIKYWEQVKNEINNL